MVQIETTGFMSDIRGQSKYRKFPNGELQEIIDAVTEVPTTVFKGDSSGKEIKRFDARIADGLPDYEFEHGSENGRNPACKLWKNDGFDHSVDLYAPDKRIAIEIEKSERKRVSDDLLKFIKGGKTQKDNRQKIEFGCLIVPTNYRGSGNLFRASILNLKFIRSVLFIEDIAVVGYRDPRWN